MKASLVLPTLNPSEKIFGVVDNAVANGFDDIIIVNDGSSPDKEAIFQKLRENPACTVLVHEKNRGKGRGLKTAFEYFLANRSPDEYAGVVTIDDDGQHTPEDIKRCADMMLESGAVVLGVRDFDSPDVPFKSRFGNKLTALVFSAGIGMKISDTQTGLRAIPTEALKVFTATEGERFEYETNMLLDIKRNGLELCECKIKTVYDDNNSGTHFRPIVDSVKIYSRILKYTAGSVLSFIIDIGLFNLLMFLLQKSAMLSLGTVTLASTCVARVFSSVFNFLYNRGVVFKHSDGSKGNLAKSALKYYALCACQMLLSAFLVSAILGVVSGAQSSTVEPLFATLIKLLVDGVLFCVSYFVQKKWVYR